MVEVNVGHDPYSWLSMLKQYIRPTDAEIYYEQQAAEHNNCGYSMIKGKPGTFRANTSVKHGQLIVIDEEAIEEAWKKQNSSFCFADGESIIKRILEQTSLGTPSSTVVDITKE